MSQEIISYLILSGVKLRQFQHWYWYTGMDGQILAPQKRRCTILYADIFYNTLTFIHFNTNQNLFWSKKANIVENDVASNSFIHRMIANI